MTRIYAHAEDKGIKGAKSFLDAKPLPSYQVSSLAVKLTTAVCLSVHRNSLSRHVVTQTVDEAWLDWQNKSPKNELWYYLIGKTNCTGSRPLIHSVCALQFDSQIPGGGLWNLTIWGMMGTTGDTLRYA